MAVAGGAENLAKMAVVRRLRRTEPVVDRYLVVPQLDKDRAGGPFQPVVNAVKLNADLDAEIGGRRVINELFILVADLAATRTAEQTGYPPAFVTEWQ